MLQRNTLQKYINEHDIYFTYVSQLPFMSFSIFISSVYFYNVENYDRKPLLLTFSKLHNKSLIKKTLVPLDI